MNTREIAEEYRLTHWAAIMRERAESGLSIRAYCEKTGFHENVYYYWQRKLRQAACEQLETPGFTEVKLLETPGQAMNAEPPQSGQIRIEAGGIQITANGGYPVEKLSALLMAVKQL